MKNERNEGRKFNEGRKEGRKIGRKERVIYQLQVPMQCLRLLPNCFSGI